MTQDKMREALDRLEAIIHELAGDVAPGGPEDRAWAAINEIREALSAERQSAERAICKTCGQSFDLSEDHACPGLIPAPAERRVTEARRKVGVIAHIDHGKSAMAATIAALAHPVEADAEEVEIEVKWRDLALQFDEHRIEAMSVIRGLIYDPGAVDMAKEFLARPPLSGEHVLATRLAALSRSHDAGSADAGWRSMDSAPKDGKHILLCVRSGAFFYTVEGAYHNNQWLAAFCDEPVQPVYWAPQPTGFVLPASPNPEGKGGPEG